MFCYKYDELYHPEYEGGVIWNDPEIGIVWPYNDNLYYQRKIRNTKH